MKTVFSSESEIAHLWANQLQSEARKAGTNNFYFRGKTIYSYGSHFPIAKHVEFKGKKAVLFTQSRYSNTTSGHISVVRHACNHLDVVYCKSPDNSHDENFDYWAGLIDAIVAKLAKARKPEIYLAQIDTYKKYVSDYCDFFKVKPSTRLKRLIKASNSEEYKALAEKKKAFKLAEQKKKQRLLLVSHKKELVKFRSGELYRMNVRDGFDYIALRGENFMTSQGVVFPVAVGLRFYEWIKNTIAKGGCKDCKKDFIGYEVRHVTEKLLIIGCHTIKMEEIERAFKLAK